MTIITRSKAKPAEIIKDASMTKQKEMMNGHYERLANAPPEDKKAVYVLGEVTPLWHVRARRAKTRPADLG